MFVIPIQLNKFDPQFATGFAAKEYIGAVLFLLASAINVWAGYTMSQLGKGTPLPLDCPNQLVVQGPYRYVRNPMAIGGISQGIAVGIILGSGLVVIYALSGAFIWHIFVRPHEELDLLDRFGNEYKVYRQTVRNWLPHLKPYIKNSY